jgi:tagaturonate reductase
MFWVRRATPNFVAVISNTTEAGIVYDASCRADQTPPTSFPAKVTRMLLERFNNCGEKDAPGFHFLPCELIDKNGNNLEKIVHQHATDWALGADFIGWLKSKNAFYNTLVDRIVPGFPRDEVESIEAELGYHDPLMVTAELFHFLVIEKRDDQPDLVLPMADKDAGTLIVPSADGYKERKVAILNGAHTGLCPLALISNTVSVKEAMDNGAASRFLDAMLGQEIIPYLSLPKEELAAFSAEVLRRFANPFILHRWHDISLNGLAKFHTRNLPRFEAAMAATGKPPRCMSLSIAAWLVFYTGDFAASGDLPPRDGDDVIALMQQIGAIKDKGGIAAMVSAFLENETIWGKNLASDDLVATVTQAYEFLTKSQNGEPFSLDRLDQWIA